jgi:periplasmic protein TonB
MLLAIRTTEEESEAQALFRWLLPASVALHALVVVAMPTSTRPGPAPPSTVVVMSELPPEPKPLPEPPKAPEAAPAPAAPARAAPTRRDEARPPPVTAAAVDFTGTVFSNDGPGVAVTRGEAAPETPAPRSPVPSAPPAPPAPPPPPALVPAAALGRPPRAPGLDTELERNYPLDARRSGISGTAVLGVELLPDGRVGKVARTSESHPGFGAACERTVRSGRWEPPIDREGRAVRTEIKYVCKFEVR